MCSIYPIGSNMFYCDKCNLPLCYKCGNLATHHHPLIMINSLIQLSEIKKKRNIDIDLFNENQKITYKKQIENLRNIYDLKEISDKELIEALTKANGNADKAIILLFH